MQEGHVDAGIVHLGDQQLGGGVSPIEHRRVILLGVGLAPEVPREPIAVYGELNVLKLTCLRVDEGRIVGGSPVAHPPHRLVVSAEFALELAPPLID